MKTRIASYLAAMFLFLSCGAAIAGDPCCSISAIDPRSGTVTAVNSANKSTVQFKAPASVLRSLKVGQKVHVDYRTKKVSLNGIAPCCNVVNVRPAEPVGQPTTAVPPATNARPAEPAGQPRATSQAASSASGSNPLGSKRGLAPVRAGRATENPGRGECADKGGEWRCTTVSTGSDPGPGDDLLSCVCINR